MFQVLINSYWALFGKISYALLLILLTVMAPLLAVDLLVVKQIFGGSTACFLGAAPHYFYYHGSKAKNGRGWYRVAGGEMGV